MKTEKTIELSECVDNLDHPNNRINLEKNLIEVWVYGTAACLNTDTFTTAGTAGSYPMNRSDAVVHVSRDR